MPKATVVVAVVRKALVCAEVGMDILVIMFVIGVFADVGIIVVASAVIGSAFVLSYAPDAPSGIVTDILIATVVGLLLAGDDTNVLARVSVNALAVMASSFKFDVQSPSRDWKY